MSNLILILTNNAGDFSTLKQTLSVRTNKPFEVEWIPYLSVAVDRLSKDNIDAVLLDLTLADSQGLETFDAIFAVAKKVTIITLCGTDDNPLAIATIARGAQATLSRSNFSSIYLPQALRNIVHRSGIELSLNQEKWRARLALNSIADAVICTDTNGIV
ncbi:MAG: response regulator, partial [Burkholderiaceae bacterium]|nr:response regulator [Burkholderiaceae bacterium]